MREVNPISETLCKIAASSTEKEQCRLVINQAFQKRQVVARRDRDIIALEEINIELSGRNKFLLMLLTKNERTLLGTVLLTIDQNQGIIQYLAVIPEKFGEGLGKKLLAYAEKIAQSFFCKTCFLTIINHPKATQKNLVKWYKTQGYNFLHQQDIEENLKIKWFAAEYHSEITLDCYQKKLS